MWRDASNEIRLHPSRFVATLMAIAISVGFLAAISTFVNTEQNAMGKITTLSLSTSDIRVQYQDGDEASAERLRAVEGVADVYPQFTLGGWTLTHKDRSSFVTLFSPPPEGFRWSKVIEGRFPEQVGEVALSEEGLKQLGLTVGDEVEVASSDTPLRIVGKTADPKSMFGTIGYVPTSTFTEVAASAYGIRIDQGADLATVMSALSTEVPGLTVETAAQYRQQELDKTTGGFDVFKGLLQGFGAVALLVGAITISNTFTILLTQRRRQIALLRAVGASTRQVAGRLVVEALLLGVIGSLMGLLLGVGVATVGSMVTGSLYWGVELRVGELVGTAAVGVLATVLAAVLPSLRATRVKPLEALQVVPTEAQAARAGVVRVVLCALLLISGGSLAVASRSASPALLWAVGGSLLLSLGVLLGAPLFVPPVLRLLAWVFGGRRPTARLALLNASRNPRRAAATATALMLAVGLIATLQVSIATARTSGLTFINERYPIDIAVGYDQGAPTQARQLLADVAGIARVSEVQSKKIIVAGTELAVRDGETPEQEIGREPTVDQDDVILVPEGVNLPEQVQVGGHDLKVRYFSKATANAAVSAAVFADIDATSQVTQIWLKMVDRSSPTTLNQVLQQAQDTGGMVFDSGAYMAAILTQILDVLLTVLTALLGVAVLIALVGVGNTLGLSVLERQRESALLRALGMQRGQLRVMLLIEAVALVGVGAVVGLVAGLFFGWLGASSVMLMLPEKDRPDLVFAVDPGWTLGLIGVCLVAACLASVLPGRRAAKATPTEALAAE